MAEILFSFDVSVCAQRLNANSSNTVKATDFKFDVLVSRDSPDMTPYNFFEMGAWPGSCDPLNFWALNANSSKTVKAIDLTFDKHGLRDSPYYMTPKTFQKGAWPGIRDPKI